MSDSAEAGSGPDRPAPERRREPGEGEPEAWPGYRPVREAPSPLWLSHHDPADYDRCVRVGRTRVCRRCLVLYPLAFAVLALALAGVRWPRALDPFLLVLLPLPAVVEFVAEHLGASGYRPVRQAAATVPLAAALGVGFDRYLERQTDPLFWGVVVVYGGICLAALLLGASRRGAAGDDPG